MSSTAVVDSGPLLASVNRADPDHAACLELLRSPELDLVIPALCVAEVSHLLARGRDAELPARFLAGLERFDVQAPYPEDWRRIGQLVRRQLGLGGTGASVIALAERLGTDLLLTLDRRRFAELRSRAGKPFRLLP